MKDCSQCKNKKCLPTGKPCEEVEKILREGGIYGREWIRPQMPSGERGRGGSSYREIPFSSLGLNNMGKPLDKRIHK